MTDHRDEIQQGLTRLARCLAVANSCIEVMNLMERILRADGKEPSEAERTVAAEKLRDMADVLEHLED